MTTEEKINEIAKLENRELVRNFGTEELNLQYRAEQRNKSICDLKLSKEKKDAACQKLEEQQKVRDAYYDEILRRMNK